MAEPIKIQLSDKYQPVTDADIRTAKNFILRRESAANGLSALIDGLLEDAAANITMLCYQFNVRPEEFQISSNYNEKLYELICNILDELEDEIMDLMLEYATKCTESDKKRSMLLPWILALGIRGKSLQQITEKRIWSFSRDVEAMIIACRMANIDRTKAISRIKSNLKSVYTIPEMKVAFAHAAEQKNIFIRSHGVKHGYRGNSNSEAVNIERMAKYTVEKAWMHQQYENYKANDEIQGYFVIRGSTFPCQLCDSMVGFHPIEDIDGYPLYHPSCVCTAIPVRIKK